MPNLNRMFRLFYTIVTISVLSIIFSCSSNNTKVNSGDNTSPINSKEKKYPELKFSEDFFDFGSIAEGEIVSHTFHFHNIGSDILVVKDLIPDCGCTLPKIDKKELKPGEESTVEVIFNSAGWSGSQYKSVTLRTNAPIREKSVTIKANVVPPKE